MKRSIKYFSLMGLFSIMSSLVLAQNEKILISDTPADLEISIKAKSKDYLGGQDEEDLKVQQQIIKPVRRFGEIESEEESSVQND